MRWDGCKLVCALLAVGSAVGAAARSPPPMRYRWNVGDRLVYDRRVEESVVGRAELTRSGREQIQIWCLSQENDESTLLVDLIRLDGKNIAFACGGLTVQRSSGVRRYAAEMDGRTDVLADAFELLPVVSHEYDGGPRWETGANEYGVRLRYAIGARDPAQQGALKVEFEALDSTGALALLGRTLSGRFWFDIDGGRVTRMESLATDGRRGTQTLAISTLYQQRQEPRSEVERLRERLAILTRMWRTENRALDEILTPDGTPRLIDGVLRNWDETLAELRGDAGDPITRIAGGWRELARGAAELRRERQRLAAGWLNSPAAQWSLQDPGGATIRSEELRDRPVLEVFWSSSSAASVQMMEPLRRLRAALAEDELRVICVNLDSDVAAARRAVEVCGQDLRHVLSGPPLAGQTPVELPVIRLLDREGRIRRVWFGWRGRLVEDVRGAM